MNTLVVISTCSSRHENLQRYGCTSQGVCIWRGLTALERGKLGRVPLLAAGSCNQAVFCMFCVIDGHRPRQLHPAGSAQAAAGD